MKALILAGGFATRLRPLSCTRPKTLFPIVNKSLLQWIFERLASSGVDEVIMAVNPLTRFYIKQYKPSKYGLRLRFSIDPPKMPLGTAGPIKKAENLLDHNEPFIVLNGDIFAEIDYKKLFETHIKKNALATIALCTVEDPSAFGVAELCEGNRIKRFIEKPSKDEAPSNLINAGAYVLSPKVLEYIPKGRAVSIEREVFPVLANEGKLCGFSVQGLWIDIGKPKEFLQANKTILDSISGKLKNPKAKGFSLEVPVAIDKGVTIAEGSSIGPYAIIGKNVKIGRNVNISDSVVFPNVQIGDDTIIKGAIVGEGACVGKNVRLGKGCIVGDLAKVKDNVCMQSPSSLCPAKELL